MIATIRTLLIIVAIFVQPVVWAGSPTYNTLYVFGDSLSDTGNDLILTKTQRISPAIPPSESPHRTYYKGRFSNGVVSVEYLWRLLQNNASASLTTFLSKDGRDLKGAAINFAFGGSASGYVNQTPGQFYVPGVLGQIDMFKKALDKKKPKGGALYVIWTGGNDYITSPTFDTPTEVVANITKAVETLYSLGARDFLIPNLPDLGLAPIVPEAAKALFSSLTDSHNNLLASARDELATRLEGARIVLVDIHKVTEDWRTATASGNPPVLFFPPALSDTDITLDTNAVSCLFVNPVLCPDVKLTISPPSPPYYFWDILHPTTLIHGYYGRAMFDSLVVK